ncbi:hypothetical protein BGZ63DRAFT_375566 [Mariannaea sp. PMI_226]|nr:hypothetical protein BGZ63DRAFT_375566 [Mariannaea sp. PMI_226]
MHGSPIGESSNSPKNEYCRNWCLKGACKRGFSCRYKHSMPNSLKDLASVGLNSYPQWWLTALGVPPMMPTNVLPETVVTAAAITAKRKSSKRRRYRKDKLLMARKERKETGSEVAQRPDNDLNEVTGSTLNAEHALDEEDDLIEI